MFSTSLLEKIGADTAENGLNFLFSHFFDPVQCVVRYFFLFLFLPATCIPKKTKIAWPVLFRNQWKSLSILVVCLTFSSAALQANYFSKKTMRPATEDAASWLQNFGPTRKVLSAELAFPIYQSRRASAYGFFDRKNTQAQSSLPNETKVASGMRQLRWWKDDDTKTVRSMARYC